MRSRAGLLRGVGIGGARGHHLLLATTAASLGWEVGIFFTFYGLDILHKDRHRELKMAALATPAGPIQIPSLLGAMPGATAVG